MLAPVFFRASRNMITHSLMMVAYNPFIKLYHKLNNFTSYSHYTTLYPPVNHTYIINGLKFINAFMIYQKRSAYPQVYRPKDKH